MLQGDFQILYKNEKYEDDLKKGIMNYFKRENIIHKMSILIPNIRVVI